MALGFGIWRCSNARFALLRLLVGIYGEASRVWSVLRLLGALVDVGERFDELFMIRFTRLFNADSLGPYNESILGTFF